MLQYAVVIPTNRTFTHIEPLLLSLQTQVFLPSQIIIVLDCRLSNLEYRDYHDRVSSIFQSVPALSLVVVNPQSDSSFFVGKGASYVRNYGRKQVESSYMMFVDDDNIFDEYFAQNLFSRRGVGSEYHTTKKIDLTTLVVPVQYDDTSTYVRVAVADGFNFALCRPRWLTTELLATTSRYVDLQLASSNCLA